MTKKSSLMGIVGLLLVLTGISFFISGIYYTLFSTILGLLGVTIDILSTIGWAGIILGIILFACGFKLVIDNETPTIKALFGILGLVIFALGVIVAFTGAVTLNAPVAIFGFLMTFALGLSMISYGFDDKVKVLKFFGDVLRAFKKSMK